MTDIDLIQVRKITNFQRGKKDVYYIDSNGNLDQFLEIEGDILPVDDEKIELPIWKFKYKNFGTLHVAASRLNEARFIARLIKKGKCNERFNL